MGQSDIFMTYVLYVQVWVWTRIVRSSDLKNHPNCMKFGSEQSPEHPSIRTYVSMVGNLVMQVKLLVGTSLKKNPNI